ncbi:MAG: amidohydrolase [Kiritimatiellae bacterium]|nr:amidohydrolase [Kiritimatiellia bacterium]
MKDIGPIIDSILPSLVELRRGLHAHPEWRFQEHETAARVRAALQALPGLELETGVGGTTGMTAVLGRNRPGPCVALRADMDALPIEEQTGKPYASANAGYMHACGHDGHMACLVGAATVLTQIAEELEGPVKFIFQPAEEGGAGALRLCEAGVLDNPPVAALFALHAWPSLDVGHVGTRPGPALASTNSIDIVIRGKGSHAASPQRAIDPILIGAHVVTALQSVVSRTTHPTDSVVVTIGAFHAGTARNIIPETAELHGTIRALTRKTRRQSVERVRQIATLTAEAYGGRAEVDIRDGYPVLVNDPGLAAFFTETARALLGAGAVEPDMPPSLGGEDLAYYAQRVPALFWRLGVRPPGAKDCPTLHNPSFDFNDAAIPTGVRLHCELVRRFGKDTDEHGRTRTNTDHQPPAADHG